jgi:hypothetical protein
VPEEARKNVEEPVVQKQPQQVPETKKQKETGDKGGNHQQPPAQQKGTNPDESKSLQSFNVTTPLFLPAKQDQLPVAGEHGGPKSAIPSPAKGDQTVVQQPQVPETKKQKETGDKGGNHQQPPAQQKGTNPDESKSLQVAI